MQLMKQAIMNTALQVNYLVILLASGMGCSMPMLNVEDAIIPPQGQAELNAYVERRWTLLTTGTVAGVPVEFRRQGRSLGKATTDRQGRASITCQDGSGNWTFSAHAEVDGHRVESRGTVYVWDPRKPVIAIDMDETLIKSKYVGMVVEPQDPSAPMDGSRQIVDRLARRYGIIYISARARLFRDMSLTWLDKHGYPPGPVVHCANFGAVFGQHQAKFELVKDLRKTLPQLTIGIGDKGADEYAFLANDMTCIIVNPFYPFASEKTIVVDHWDRVDEVLDAEMGSQGDETEALSFHAVALEEAYPQ